jgi:hypothetical protein
MRLPRLMVCELVKHSVLCLNQIQADDGVSDTLSPNTIITGNPNPDYNQLKLEFGTYVQIYDPSNFSSNTLQSRTTGAIALGHTGNTQVDLSLVAGRRLSRHQWTALSVTEAVITRVEQLAEEENQPGVQSTGLLFEWRPNHPIDEDNDPNYIYNPEQEDD